MKDSERLIAERAARQFGLIADQQALRLGMSARTLQRRKADDGWDELLPGVCRLPGAPRTTQQMALAATLWAGPGSAASHCTATHLLRFDGVRAEGVDLTIPQLSGLRSDRVRLHRTASLPTLDRVAVDGIPCTAGTRTIIDCAAVLDDETLEAAFESARRLGLTSPAYLARRAEELCGRGRPGSKAIRRLLALQAPDQRALDSRLEVKVARLLRASTLPPPVRQHWVSAPDGTRYRIDFAWPRLLLALECEGFQFHGRRLAWKRDRARLSALARMGWRVLFVTWDDVMQRPQAVLDAVADALRAG